MVFLNLLENIRSKTAEILDAKNYEHVKFSVESAKPGFGDITCNVPFLLSKQLKKSPQEISRELSTMYNFDDMPEIKNVESHPSGYLNFSIDYTKFNDFVIRLSLQELGDKYSLTNNEIRDCIEMHSSLPDLWDLAQGAWEDCSGTSRFVEEGAQQDLIQGIKSLTNKPVVGVGRFTSPDLMVKQIKSGNLDFIGAARPSIADPFLPNKIRDGKIDEIRECIGCNICVTGDMTMSISRCTQNPSFMEEWRKGWHPENFQIKGESKSILVIGSGPAGVEATRCLSKRGYDVTLAEKNPFMGGRVTKERLLPGLSAWGRVVDYREGQINKLKNVKVKGLSTTNPGAITDAQVTQ